MRLACLAALAFSLLAGSAQAGWYGVYRGNDTGGIIPWSPEIRYTYRDIAANYCARWNKVAKITSVNAWYGDYVGFRCHWPRGYDPVAARYSVRARY